MLTYILAFLACAGWLAFMVAEAAYHDLRVERDRYANRALSAEAQLRWHGQGAR